MDIPRVVRNFMWSNNHDPPLWSKINWFLLSPNWEAQFLDVSQWWLPRVLSEHFLLLLDCDNVTRSKEYFEFGICG
jgi:hypothetical protein